MTTEEAYDFLREVPLLESSGVVVRIPDWWKKRSRPEVKVTIGEKPPSTLGTDSLLGFDVSLALDGETISKEEWEKLLASTEGLAFVKGKWVEVDQEKLQEALGRAQSTAISAHHQAVDVEHLASALLEDDQGLAASIVKIAGWLGLATAVAAWYASFAEVTNATFKRIVLPVRPLSR